MHSQRGETSETRAAVIPIAPAQLRQRGDDELMQLAAAGLQPAMVELIRRYQQRVRSYCRKWDPERGDDLAQEALLRLWQARGRYRPGGRLEVFLFTIVRNCCKNARRGLFRRWRATEALKSDRAAQEDAALARAKDLQPAQLDLLLARERQRRVAAAIAELPAKLKESLLLRVEQELSYADIARIVGAPEATARSRVHLAVKRLQRRLEEETVR